MFDPLHVRPVVDAAQQGLHDLACQQGAGRNRPDTDEPGHDHEGPGRHHADGCEDGEEPGGIPCPVGEIDIVVAKARILRLQAFKPAQDDRLEGHGLDGVEAGQDREDEIVFSLILLRAFFNQAVDPCIQGRGSQGKQGQENKRHEADRPPDKKQDGKKEEAGGKVDCQEAGLTTVMVAHCLQ